MELDGFLLLCRTIESKRFSLKSSLRSFSELADLMDEDSGKKSLSFRAFCLYCRNKNYFHPKKINSFISANVDLTKLQSLGKEEYLKKEWNLKKDMIKLKYLKGRMFSSYLMDCTKTIDSYLENNEIKKKEYEIEAIFMKFILISNDSDVIYLDMEMEGLIPAELIHSVERTKAMHGY